MDLDKWCATCININTNNDNIKNQCYFCKRITSVRALDKPYNYKIKR